MEKSTVRKTLTVATGYKRRDVRATPRIPRSPFGKSPTPNRRGLRQPGGSSFERSLSKSEPLKSQAIGLTTKILLQCVHKNLIVRCNAREQSHRGSKLQVIGVAENLFY